MAAQDYSSCVTSSLAMLISTEGTDCAKDPVGFGNSCPSSLQYCDDYIDYNAIFNTVKTYMENLTQETFTKNDFLRKPQTFPTRERKVIYKTVRCNCSFQ